VAILFEDIKVQEGKTKKVHRAQKIELREGQIEDTLMFDLNFLYLIKKITKTKLVKVFPFCRRL
jgi:hypothetical protein